MIASNARSFQAAWANTRATGSRNPDSGQPRPFTLRRRLFAAVGAIIWVTAPGVTIEAWNGFASGRLTSVRTARTIVGPALGTAVGLLIGAEAAATTGWFYVCTALMLALIIPLVVSIEVVHSARKYPEGVTHILTDVVRHPDAPTGSGARLVEALATDPTRVIGADARNDQLWRKVYAPHADQVGKAGDGKTRFVLRSMAVQQVG